MPGFYLDDSGRWTMNFYRKNAGILIPAVGYDGMIHGLQIPLDIPLKQKDDPPDNAQEPNTSGFRPRPKIWVLHPGVRYIL